MVNITAKNGGGDSRRVLFFLTGDDGFHRTLVSTGATIRTKTCINDIFVFAFADGFHWALVFAGTAGNAIIRNNVSHFFYLSS
jgi:hypothetical protein